MNLNLYISKKCCLADKWIITAAHCLMGKSPKDYEVKVGTNDLEEGGVLYKPDLLIVHSR